MDKAVSYTHLDVYKRQDHGSAAADQGNRLVACHLQALHQGQGHKVACGQAVGSAVKADVKGCLLYTSYSFQFWFLHQRVQGGNIALQAAVGLDGNKAALGAQTLALCGDCLLYTSRCV